MNEPSPIQLRPYQQEAHDAILAELERVRATLLVLATGLGKTIVFASVAEKYIARGERVLVLAHRKELIAQAADVFIDMGIATAIEQANDWAPTDMPGSVTIASVLSLQRERMRRFPADTFSLIVVDEAHHSVARSYLNILKYFEGAKVLGVTATPDRTDKKGLRHAYDSCAYRMEIGPGIKQGWLAPIELKTITVKGLDLSNVKVVAGELHQGELAQALEAEQVLLGVAVPLIEQAAGRQTICFCAGVAQAHAIAALLRTRDVTAAAIDAKTPDEEREQVLADYHAKRIQVVCNAMILTEGFDAPETACIALARPTGSRSLLAQMIGRGTRKAPGKDRCLVLDFVPERKAKIRLAGPRDVLAGQELDAALAEKMAAMEGNGMTLAEQMEQAERELAAEKAAEAENANAVRKRRRQYIRQVGIAYAATTVPLHELLGEVCPHANGDTPPNEWQVEGLMRAGFKPQEIAEFSARQAEVILEIVRVRRAKGLCTMKQARLLQRFGLRADVSFDQAGKTIDAISKNGWEVPDWMAEDPKYLPPAMDVVSA